MGIWPPRNFAPWRLLLTLLCIPLFYMIFLTIIYNWMCSWIYFLYKKKKICCAQFSMYITTGFCFCFVGGEWGGSRGGSFYLLCSQTPSFQHILLSLVLSSSYTMYYQFWYNYIYINIKLYIKGYLKPIHGNAGAWYTVKWIQHWTFTDLGRSLLWKCWN